MKWSKISLCYYPTTTTFIDDKKSFLKTLDLSLNNQLFYRFYTQPEEFIEYINQHYQFDPFTTCCVSVDDDQIDLASQNLNIRLIRNAAANPNRFNQISTLVCDYAMPTKNGLDCCQAISDNYFIRKILLTGQADNNLAVDAFNDGIIHKFIQKTSNVAELINSAVQEAQMKYFINLSEKFYDMLPLHTQRCLTDPAFVDFFYQLCAEKKIVEYYLTDEYGGFLMLDGKGKPSWLAVANQDQMEGYYQIASFEENVPRAILDGLKIKQVIPYFYTDSDLQTAANQWESYLHPAKALVGKDTTYYYSFIDDPSAYDIDRQAIFSYQTFLQAMD